MSTTRKFICIHGHFYQPPRENAWLETIESQPSAAPFHDWNERINFECYAPNAAARILNDQQRISGISNNYERISFNFGPTLLSWLAEKDPTTYRAIQEADKQSQKRFGGHGSALAQVYNHLIMPLANARDRHTQVRWGVEDFKHRFGRQPEGMWLAESAVDTPTLEALVDHGVTYTVLAPRQAKSVRFNNEEHWHNVNENNLDTRRPYRCHLPSGRHIDLFFYNGEVSRSVAFEGLLNDGKLLANKLMNVLDANDDLQLSHIATDGESYGHHHRKGEMALAACLDHIDQNPHFTLTNYGQYLELFPPEWECEIHENSSWSCVHGVERWRSNCGCHTGGEAGWTQNWRAPLRDALDMVRDRLIPVFEQLGKDVFKDPWQARDQYIQLLLDRSSDNVVAFVKANAKQAINEEATTLMLRLLEMQRHAMLMYTSCGWFFNEVSGIETLQILQYAQRALHLAKVLTGEDHHPEFIRMLENTPSNVHDNAAVAYRENIMPAKVGLLRVGMHYAASSLFEEEPEKLDLFTYQAQSHDFVRLRAGSHRLAIGRTSIQSRLTRSHSSFAFACLYLGQQSVIGVITDKPLALDYTTIVERLGKRFRDGDPAYLIKGIQDYFGEETFSLWHLFRDEKKKILLMITQRSLDIASANFSDTYYDNYQLMSSMQANHLALPVPYLAAISFTLRRRTLSVLEESPIDLRRLSRIVTDYEHWQHQWESITAKELEKAAEERVFKELLVGLAEPSKLSEALKLLRLLKRIDLTPDFWQSQNSLLSVMQKQPETLLLGLEKEELIALGDELNVSIPPELV